jgi:hypothetical protein
VNGVERKGVSVIAALLPALGVMTVVGAIVDLPGGNYDMQGLWVIGLAGTATWLVGTVLLAFVLRRQGPHK